MKKIILYFLLSLSFNALAFMPVCQRTEQIKLKLEQVLGKKCQKIQREDLAKLDLSRNNLAIISAGAFSGLYEMSGWRVEYVTTS